MSDYFFDTDITVSDSFIDSVKKFVAESSEDDWKNHLQMTLLTLPLELFKDEPELLEIIDRFGAQNRLAVYKTTANSSYHWHKDATRHACLNVLLDGYDSLCLFSQAPVNGMMYELEKLDYVENKVFLLDVSKLHTVINFNNERHLLSIGIPRPTTYGVVKAFVEEKFLDKKTK